MYHKFYHLKENPFNITADPDFFYSSAPHADAFAHLIYGINQRKGIIVITGEIGTGKTTLCRTLLNKLDSTVKTALVLNPSFSELQLLKMILNDLGIKTKAKSKFDMITALNQFLLEETSHGNNVAIIIDEAQNLKVPQLEQVRLLSNLETEKEKLLQIILVGQPELIDKLKLPELRQLNQRVCVRYHLTALDPGQLKHYIHHRLNVAQESAFTRYKVHFTDEAIDAIYEFTHGTPRMINIICDRALLAGFSLETYSIDRKIIHQCVREVGQK